MSFSSPPKTLGLTGCEIARYDDRLPLVAVGDEVEEQLAAGSVEGHEAQFVEDEQVDPVHPALEAREFASVACLEQHADEIGGAPEGDVPALARGLETECDREVRLPRADRAREDQVLRLLDPRAARRDSRPAPRLFPRRR